MTNSTLPLRHCHFDIATSILPLRYCHFDIAISTLPLRSLPHQEGSRLAANLFLCPFLDLCNHHSNDRLPNPTPRRAVLTRATPLQARSNFSPLLTSTKRKRVNPSLRSKKHPSRLQPRPPLPYKHEAQASGFGPNPTTPPNSFA